MEDVHLGGKFWLAAIGIVIAACIGGGLIFLLINAAWIRWGAIGSLVLFCGVLLLAAYIYDHTHTRPYDEEPA